MVGVIVSWLSEPARPNKIYKKYFRAFFEIFLDFSFFIPCVFHNYCSSLLFIHIYFIIYDNISSFQWITLNLFRSFFLSFISFIHPFDIWFNRSSFLYFYFLLSVIVISFFLSFIDYFILFFVVHSVTCWRR